MPNSTPDVSVIITTYNRAGVLPRAIESALSQTFENIEIIVVDDASTDDTPSVVSRYRDDRIRYIQLESNSGGDGEPTNRGIKEARAPILAILNDDDSARPVWIESLIDSLASFPDVGMAWGQEALRDTNGKLLGIALRDPFNGSEPKVLPLMLKWTPGNTGLLIRRSVFDEIGFFDPNAGILSDIELAIRFANCGHWGVRVVPKVLLDYSCYTGSGSNSVTPAYLRAVRYCFEKHKHTIAAYPHVEADWQYRMSRACNFLGMHKESDEALSQAIKSNPYKVKYHCCRFAQRYGLLRFWHAMSTVRCWLERRKKKVIYKAFGDRAASPSLGQSRSH